MKIFSKTLIGLLITGSLISCEDYLDVNESPINPTLESVNPDLLLAGALTTPYNAQQYAYGNANELGNVMMNNWASDVQNFTGGYIDEFSLTVTTSFYADVWDETFVSLGTLQAIIDEESGVYDNHRAIATLMRTFYYQMLVDLYGDIPYSEALDLTSGNYTPAYDDDQMIYRSLVEDIENAIVLINSADDEDAEVGSEDVIFQGDMSQWLEFANTLKLRLLVRQITLAETDGETATYLNEEFGELNQNFLTEDMTINPGYVQATGQQNPFYENWGFDPQGSPASEPRNRLATAAADYAVEFLKGNQPNNPNLTENIATGVYDPRLERLYDTLPADAEENPGEVMGVVQGAQSDNAPPRLSLLGPGIIDEPSQNGFIMEAAQSYFLQAEAVYRGYLSGDAKELFQQGIIASFVSLGLTEDDAQDYIDESNGVERIGWDGSSDKIEAIMTQKWIATNGRNAQESWIEYRRTGYPEVPLPITAQQPNLPTRLLYPASEYSTNSANVPQQSQADAFNSRVFWDVN